MIKNIYGNSRYSNFNSVIHNIKVIIRNFPVKFKPHEIFSYFETSFDEIVLKRVLSVLYHYLDPMSHGYSRCLHSLQYL